MDSALSGTFRNCSSLTLPPELPENITSLNTTIGGILNGTQRALSFANQAIPFVKQVKPMIGNAKTMFKVMNEFKRSEKPRSNVNSSNLRKNSNNYIENNKVTNIKNENISSNNGPTFFM